MSLPYSFALCRANLDELVKVSDRQIRDAMGVLFREMKLELLSRKADPQVELRGGIFECRTPFPGGVYTSRNSWEVRLRDAGTRYCQPRPQQLRGLIRSKFFKDGNFVLEDQGTPSNASVRRSIL